MNTSLRIVCLSITSPSPSGSGGATATYGLGAALVAAGHEVHFAVVHRPNQRHIDTTDFPVHFLSGPNGSVPPSTDQFIRVLQRLSADVVWVFQTHCWHIFAPLRYRYPHVLYTLDPPWEVELLRRRWRKPAPDFLRKIVYSYRNWRRVSELRNEERTIFRKASESGIVVGYTASETPGMVKRTGVDVQVCTLAYPDWGMRPSLPDTDTPQALLLGHMSSTHTRYGLRYFFDEVWPVWCDHNNPPRSEIRVVGGGRLPEGFTRPPETDHLKWIGFVPSLEDEWNKATGLLVPVPLTNGIRARIVESWCRGIPVIAHPSAEAGLPMMCRGENYLAVERADEWIAAVRSLEKDPNLATFLARNGRKAFEQELSVKARAKQFNEVSHLAIQHFESNAAKESR